MRRGAGSSDLTTRATHTGLVWSRPTGYRVDRTRCLCSTSSARNRARTVCRRRTNEIARCDPGGDAVVSGGGCRELPGQGDRGRGRRHIHDGIEDRTSARPDLLNRCAGTRPARLRTRCRRALSEAHLRQILQSHARYYNDIRTHRSLDKDAPVTRQLANRKRQITRHSWRTSPPLRPSLSFRYRQGSRSGAD